MVATAVADVHTTVPMADRQWNPVDIQSLGAHQHRCAQIRGTHQLGEHRYTTF